MNCPSQSLTCSEQFDLHKRRGEKVGLMYTRETTFLMPISSRTSFLFLLVCENFRRLCLLFGKEFKIY